jgi:hypothetical protein
LSGFSWTRINGWTTKVISDNLYSIKNIFTVGFLVVSSYRRWNLSVMSPQETKGCPWSEHDKDKLWRFLSVFENWAQSRPTVRKKERRIQKPESL